MCIKPVGQYWPSGIGTAIFTFEGVGIILPIKEIIREKKSFTKVFGIAISAYGLVAIVFSVYSLFGYGAE